ncbi:MAG TPA: GFA family protein, partial [Pseudorhizobium sp.]|nr:GFA family protein [Pseudorhizobium sp.]
MEERHVGRCLCGGVNFETTGRLREVIACHCSQCRRQTGLYYAATDVELDRLRLVSQETLTWFRASDTARRGFCSQCGSALFWQADGSNQMSILAGAFDQPSGLKMGYHIFCD